MKHLFILLITFNAFSFIPAQGEIKARIEFEDAETAFESKDYRKTINHLKAAENLLGKWTVKTGYLKMLSLDNLVDYGGEWNENTAELKRQLTEYMKYAEANPTQVDIEKMREAYAIEKRINFAMKKRDMEADPDYKAGKEAYDRKDYAEAMDHYLKAANKNNTRAMDEISDMYRDGIGFAVDNAKSLEWDTKAAELGDPISKSDLGYMYLTGKGVAKDYRRAQEYFEEGVNFGLGSAFANIGRMYAYGLGPTGNVSVGEDWLLKSAIRGNNAGLVYLGNLYYQLQNYPEALNWLMKASDSGVGFAMFKIGEMYHGGKGVTQSCADALAWYTKALDKEYEPDGTGFTHMASCAMTANDYSSAKQWYEKAYEKGDAEAKRLAAASIARMYDEGLGVEKDRRKAREWRYK